MEIREAISVIADKFRQHQREQESAARILDALALAEQVSNDAGLEELRRRYDLQRQQASEARAALEVAQKEYATTTKALESEYAAKKAALERDILDRRATAKSEYETQMAEQRRSLESLRESAAGEASTLRADIDRLHAEKDTLHRSVTDLKGEADAVKARLRSLLGGA